MVKRIPVSISSAIAFALFVGGCTTHTSIPLTATSVSASNTIREVLTIEPTSLDPATVPDVTTEQLIQYTFEGLTRFNEKNEIESCLAERWDISPDGKTYTFHLRKGVTFHNGRAFTAADVKYSFERSLSPHTASAQAQDYLDGILGLRDVVSGKKKDLAGVTVLDDSTVKVEIDRPRAYFTGMLTMPQDYIVCKEAVANTDGKVTTHSFVGTGPFMFESYRPGQQISLLAYPGYWGGKPTCSRVEMPVILNPQTAYDNFLTSKVDILPDLPIVRYGQDKEQNKNLPDYHVSPLASFAYIGLQEARQPAFRKKDVRRAIAMAIDRDEIVRVAFKSVPRVATGVLPKEMPLAGAAPPQFTLNVTQAKDLLAKAGYPGGKGFPALTLSYIQQDHGRESEAVIVRKNLHDNLGIEVSLSPREAGDFFTAEQKHGNEMWIGGWVADYLDPQDFLSTLFVTGKPMNFYDYSNAAFDALCNEADGSLDNNRRAELYGKAHAIVMDDLPVIPIYFTSRVSLVHANIKGWRECAIYVLPDTQVTKN